MGRPVGWRKENPRSESFQVRLTKDEKNIIDHYCDTYNVTASDFFRSMITVAFIDKVVKEKLEVSDSEWAKYEAYYDWMKD